MEKSMEALVQEIVRKGRSGELRQFITDLLLEICAVDTTPDADVSVMRAAEEKVFAALERELARNTFAGARCERRPINPAIKDHPGFSLLHFTKTASCPQGLSAEATYAGRHNLLYFVPGQGGVEANGVALNAHIDVVKPYFPPRLEDGIIYGRGSCDDKGSIVVMLAALRVLSEVLRKSGRQLRRNLVGMCVIEEETGGNGSLSLAMDRELKKLYDTILVMECCGNNIHPANRGAVWYRADLRCGGANLFEMSAFVYEQLELEGRSIKAESRHSLFPQRPVQTCHGQIGAYGEHPSRICGKVAFELLFDGEVNDRVKALVEDGIASALADYIGLYGDKTKVNDPTTGKPKVDRHVDLEHGSGRILCTVHGSTGHMGSIMENDGAITKMAAFVRILYRMKGALQAASGGQVSMRLAGEAPAEVLKLEGGQGFVPTHAIGAVMERFRRAARDGAANYLRLEGRTGVDADGCVEMTYDKLHNAAFDGDPDSAQMRHAIAAAREAGIWSDDKAIMGWTVSCDSRLFAFEYPEMPVLTSGAGLLQYAHSDSEQVKIDDLVGSAVFVALYLLREAGVA